MTRLGQVKYSGRMNDMLWLGLIATVPAAVSPLLLSWLNSRNVRREKLADYERQDAVAARAEFAVEAASARAAEAARLLLAANERVAATAKITNEKLDGIHTLVNSNMTTSMQAEHDATVRELALMREVIALHRAEGREPDVESLAAVEATGRRIAELHALLADRLKQATPAVGGQAGLPAARLG